MAGTKVIRSGRIEKVIESLQKDIAHLTKLAEQDERYAAKQNEGELKQFMLRHAAANRAKIEGMEEAIQQIIDAIMS